MRRIFMLLLAIAIPTVAALVGCGAPDHLPTVTAGRGSVDVVLVESGEVSAVRSRTVRPPMEWDTSLVIVDMAEEGSRIAAGDPIVQLEAGTLRRNLVQGVESALTVLKSELADRIKVVRDYGEIPEVMCYPAELNQVFLNLLSNAAKAIDGEGTITVATADADDGRVRIVVSDTGRGIDPAALDHLFDPTFTTGDDRVKMGWGLTTVDQVVRKHGGEVEVESDVGVGTVFSVVLPVDQT